MPLEALGSAAFYHHFCDKLYEQELPEFEASLRMRAEIERS
jgi:hypothetical protein